MRYQYLLKNTTYLFWGLFIPVVFAVFLQFILQDKNIITRNDWESIPVAVIEDSQNAQQLIKTMQKINSKTSLGTRQVLFKVLVLKEDTTDSLIEEGEKLLTNNQIKGCIFLDKNKDFQPNLLLKDSDELTFILKTFLELYIQKEGKIENFFWEDNKVEIQNKENIIYESIQISFYILLIIVSFFGSYLGLKESIYMRKDLSVIGMRMEMAPISRKKLFFSHIFLYIIVQIGAVFIFTAFLYKIAKDIFKERLLSFLFICSLAAIIGIFLGLMIGASNLKSLKLKYFLNFIITIGGAILAGIFFLFLEKKEFLFTFWNPASIILYTFYAIIGDSKKDFYIGIRGIFCFLFLFSIGIYFFFRRKNNASI